MSKALLFEGEKSSGCTGVQPWSSFLPLQASQNFPTEHLFTLNIHLVYVNLLRSQHKMGGDKLEKRSWTQSRVGLSTAGTAQRAGELQ